MTKTFQTAETPEEIEAARLEEIKIAREIEAAETAALRKEPYEPNWRFGEDA